MDKVREASKGGCVKMWTRGEGVQKSENFADVINGWSLEVFIIYGRGLPFAVDGM